MSKIKNQSIQSFFWVFLEKFNRQIISLVISIILARLLEPKDFGLIALVSVFMGITKIFLDFGFKPALIQRQDLSQTDYSTIFYVNLICGIFLTLLLFFCSSIIASFYNEPQLSLLIKVISINIFLESLKLIQIVQLEKNINFKHLTKVRIYSQIISGSIGIYSAFNNCGVWSLVIHMISSNLLSIYFLFLYSNWLPSREFKLKSIKKIFHFSKNIFSVSVIANFFKKIDILLISQFFNASDIGFYNRAKVLHQYPISNISSIFKIIFFPILSKFQNDNKKLKRYYLRISSLIAYIHFPMMLGLYLLSEPLIVVLLTDKWLPAVPLLKMFCIVGLTYPISAFSLNILLILNKSKLFLKLTIAKILISLLFMIIGINWGIIGLLVAKIISSIIGFFINIYFSSKELFLSFFSQILIYIKYFLISLVMIIIVYYLTIFIIGLYLKIILSIVLSIFIYIFLSILFNLSPFYDIKRILINK